MTYMLSEIREEPEVLRRLACENKAVLDALCAELRKRDIKHVTFAGRGTSDHAAIYGQYVMSIVGGVNAGLAVPSCISLYGADIYYGDSLVIAISQSGSAEDALAVVESAKACGAVTLSVTNDPESKLARAAKYHLCCAAGKEKSVAATKTFTSQLALLYLLAARRFAKPEMEARFSRFPDALGAFIDDFGKSAGALALRYRYIENGFVMARGVSYPIALETVLKIQETCYVRLSGYSSADFYHGPMARIDALSPVIIYALRGRSMNDNAALAEKVVSLGAEPLVVTDDPDAAKRFAVSYLLPDVGSELLSPILAASFAQLFAEALCALRGGDPDNPRNLKKVTVTR